MSHRHAYYHAPTLYVADEATTPREAYRPDPCTECTPAWMHALTWALVVLIGLGVVALVAIQTTAALARS